MKNIFKWSARRTPDAAERDAPETPEQTLDTGEIPIPEIYADGEAHEPTVPELKVLKLSSSDDGDEGYDPYDTTVIIEE